MNKILSQAIRKAVSDFSPEVKEYSKEKRPDLFSLNDETELFQNSKGITIKINRSKDSNLTEFGKATLSDRYLGANETFQDLFARVASHYADDTLDAQRLYNYMSNLWFMPATPVLSNGGATSTTSPPIKLSPFKPLRSCCASKVVIPPTSGVPVPGA